VQISFGAVMRDGLLPERASQLHIHRFCMTGSHAQPRRLPPHQFHHRRRERFGFFLRQIVAGIRDHMMAAAAV